MLTEQQPHTTTITIAPDKPHENGIINIRGNGHDGRSPTKQPKPRSTQHSSTSNNNTTPPDPSYTPSVTPSTQTIADDDDDNEDPKQRGRLRHRRSCISFQDHVTDNYLERGRRLNGIQLPLHPLQLSGWVAIIGFGVSTYLVLIPALHPTLQTPLIYVVGCLYAIHFATHLAALLIDPSDLELRKQCSKRIVPEFDRTKHAHVIENGRCHLCNIKIKSSRTKHCSVCNKCVEHFDHHCKWLNHCVGGRNYVAFLMCVVSAVITALVILGTVIAELILYYLKSEWLTLWAVNTANATNLHSSETLIHKSDAISSTVFNDSFIEFIGNDTTMPPDIMFNATESLFDMIDEQMIMPIGISVRDAIFLTFITLLGILAAVTVGLLLHLCFFHVYISFLGLTTYEYIRNERQKDALKEANKNKIAQQQQVTEVKVKPPEGLQVYFCSHIDPKNLIENHESPTNRSPQSLFCCDSSMQYNSTTHKAFYVCTVLHDRSTKITTDDDVTAVDDTNRVSRSKTYHCCSEYRQIVKLSDGVDESATNMDESIRSDTNTSIEEYVKFTEQCTFCSFKLKTMRVPKAAFVDETPTDSNLHTFETSLDARKSKRQRSTTSVPESGDSLVSSGRNHINSISESIDRKSSGRSAERLSHRSRKENGVNAAGQISRVAVNGYSDKSSTLQSINSMNSHHRTPALTRSMKRSGQQDTARRMWPEGINSLLRKLSRFRTQPHYADNLNAIQMNGHGSNGRGVSPRKNQKPNQIHPVDSSDQEYEDVHYRQPHDVRRNLAQHLKQQQQQQRNKENGATADDEQTSIEENDLVQSRHLERPAPPPPVRRKISTAADMQQLAETLSFIQNPQHHHHHLPSKVQRIQRDQFAPQAMQRTIPVNNRRRRKNNFRTRSPNLSPIHESGYSNPTSPQPFRNHSMQFA